jgi:hypothetical protein
MLGDRFCERMVHDLFALAKVLLCLINFRLCF